MKMMIVGKEQVGKTSLVREICGRSPNSKLHLSFVTGQAKLERTDGIDICQWPPPPTSIAKFCTFPPSAGGAAGGIGGPMVEAVLEEKKPAKGRGQHNYMYSIWDFAGQNLYYTTHEFFLSSTAVYAVVINLLTPTSGLIEWLNSIQFRAPGSVVYLIGTFADKLTESKILSVSKTLSKCIDGWKRRVSATASMQSPTLGRKDGGQVSEAAQPIIEIKTCWYRLKKDNRAVELVLWPVCCKPFAPAQGVSEFCHSLVDHARTKVQAIPDKYFPFMAALQSRSHPPVISWQEFKDWALSFGIEKRGVLQVAQLFDCWGVIVYHQVDAARRLAVPTTDGASPSTAEPMTGESLSEEDSHDEDASMVIVSPQWLTSLFRSLVSMRHTEGGWAHSGGGSGLVRRETIEERWLDESLVQRDHFPFVWGLLNQFEICVPRDPPHASTSDTPVGSSHSDAPSANVEAFQQHKGPPAHQLSSPDELIVPACVTVKKSKSLQQLHQNLEETLHCKMSRRYAIDFLLPALFNRLSVRLNDDVLPLLSDDASGDSPFLVSSDFWDNGLSFYRGLSKTAGDKPKRLLSPISASAAAFPLSTVAVLVGTMTGSVESADSDKGEELLLLCELKDTAVEEQCFHRTLEVTVLGGGGQRDHVRKLFVAANTTIENFVRDRYPSLLHHISISCLVYSDATTCIGDEASPSLPDADGELGSSRARTGKKLRTATCYEISREFCIDQLMAGETSIPIERPGGGQLTVALEELIPEVFESGTLRCSSGYFHAEVSLLRALGAGVSAEVYHGLWKGINGEEEAATAANKRGEAIGVDVAVKMFTHKRNLLNVESLRQECLLLSSLRHPCVVRLHRFYLKPPCVLMDYHAHGSLSDFLQLVTSYTLCHADGILQDVQPTAPPPPCMEPSEAPEADRDEQGTLVEEALGKPATASVSTLRTAVAQWICSGGGLSLEFVTRIALNVASGLAYLHSRSPPVRHADIKPANVLMNCFHCPATGVCLLAAMELEASGQPSTVAGSQQLFESPQQDARCKKNDCGIEEKTERETTTTAADVDGTERHKVHCHCGQAENNCEWPDNEETVVCKLADFGFSCFESARDRDLARTEAEDDTIQFGVMMAEVVEAYVHIPLEREDQICAYRELCDLLLECRSKSVAMETARGRLALLLASLTQKTCRAM